MKKILLFTVLLLGVFPMTIIAQEQTFVIDGICYRLISKSGKNFAEVTSGDVQYTGDIVIPDVVTYDNTEYEVVTIGRMAFAGSSGMTSVSIPNSVVRIEDYAFRECSGLKYFVFPNSVTEVGVGVLSYCTSLVDCNLPSGAKTIYAGLFGGCESLTTFSVPDGILTIGDSAFQGCIGLTSIGFNGHETKIGQSAFKGCSSLVTISLPDGVTDVENSLFEDCTNLAEVHLPNDAISIGSHVFENCTSLKSVVLPDGITSIGSEAFRKCFMLEEVHFSSNLSSIGKTAFQGCYSLKDVCFPDHLCEIGAWAFDGCGSLTSITLPDGVNTIGECAFRNCPNLTTVTLPNSLASISQYSFADCVSLKSIRIPQNVEEIENMAFENSGLRTIDFSSKLRTIRIGVFRNCTELTEITIPESVSYIGIEAFQNCKSLKRITILGSHIDMDDARIFENCPNIEDVYCWCLQVPSINNSTFRNSDIEYATLHVWPDLFDAYKADAYWGIFGNIVPLDGEPPQSKKCEPPILAYKDGELMITCNTEGAQYITTITDQDVGTFYSDIIKLGCSYDITAYAVAEGYENSDVVTATLCWIDAEPVEEGFVDGVATMKARPVIVQCRNGIITMTGQADNSHVMVYTMDGVLIGQATTINGSAIIPISQQNLKGVAIVKTGGQSVKISIK